MTLSSKNLTDNPYVGPRTFGYADRKRFFGREAEAASLLARVVSERLLLFYAQSGAGKSSLINARLTPALREEEGFSVLPVGRVAGQLPTGVETVDNIFLFNLMASLDQGGDDPARLAHLELVDFLEHMVTDDGLTWRYDLAGADTVETPEEHEQAGPPPRFALVIDQFEEIVTSHADRWREREEFFRQLDAALQANPNLWVVLSLREDYVATLDPYAPLTFNRLRARVYMERMGVAAALEAIRRPAALGGRPFAPGVAEKLVDDLRQVRVPGQEQTVPGQHVEPVQMQVVCFQMWERLQGTADDLPGSFEASRKVALETITSDDLQAAGDVDSALAAFYETAIAQVVNRPELGVSEQQLRTWFSTRLITEAGTRGTVFRDDRSGLTAGLPNAAVEVLARQFLLRTELRAGGAWVELVHDRFVAPILASNTAWFPTHLNTLQRQAALWDEQGRSSGLLLRDAALAEAETWVVDHADDLEDYEQEFLAACREGQAIIEREHRQSRRIRFLALAAVSISILAIGTTVLALWNADLATKTLKSLEGERLVGEAFRLMEQEENAEKAIAVWKEAIAIDPNLQKRADLFDFPSVALRYVATQMIYAGEELARNGKREDARQKFEQALELNPPSDTPIYVYIEPGSFQMGYSDEERKLAIKECMEAQMPNCERDNAGPQQEIHLDGFWIQRTEVTNGQYQRCVEADVCSPPVNNPDWNKPDLAKRPITNVSWWQAQEYATWVGGLLPTWRQWEKACKQNDSNQYVPIGYSPVGSYAARESAHEVYDMTGNVWEWTADINPETWRQWMSGGAIYGRDKNIRCTYRFNRDPDAVFELDGFRVVSLLSKESEAETKKIYAQWYAEEGRSLAQDGDMAGAIAMFEEALALDADLGIEPQIEANRIYARALVDLGRSLAQKGDLAGATIKFEEALTLDPSLPIEPALLAQIESGKGLLASGAFTEGLAALAAAQTISPTLDIINTMPADVWYAVCWRGSLTGVAAEVMPACERAITLAPEDGGIRDSLGLARALTGDLEGARKDFEFAVQWTKEISYDAAFIESRTAWIAALQAGENPFDEPTLEQLRN